MWYFSASHFFFQYPPIDAKPAEVDLKEDFEDTKGAIRFRISKKNRQRNGQKKKYKRVVQKGNNKFPELRIAPHFEDIVDASSAHKIHALIANYKRYVCVCI